MNKQESKEIELKEMLDRIAEHFLGSTKENEELDDLIENITDSIRELYEKKAEDLDEYCCQDIIENITEYQKKKEGYDSSIDSFTEILEAFVDDNLPRYKALEQDKNQFAKRNSDLYLKYEESMQKNKDLQDKYNDLTKVMKELEDQYQRLVDYVNALDGAIRIDNALKAEAKNFTKEDPFNTIKGGYLG